jgi:hypothetical protein
MNKKIAAVLNLFLWGIGYIYAGKRKELGVLLFLGYILLHVYWFSIGLSSWLTLPAGIAFIGHILISIGLAYDVYKDV